MKIMVTGATGLIGSHLVHALMADQNNHVIAVSRSESKLCRVFERYLTYKNFEYVVQDFTRPFALADLMYRKNRDNVDLIFHAASPISAEEREKFPLSIIKSNINAVENLFDDVIQLGIHTRVVLFSSVAIYGVQGNYDISVTEEDTCVTEPLGSSKSPYSETKRMLEELTRAYIKEYGMNAVIVRPSGVYGYTIFPPKTEIYSFLQAIFDNEDILINTMGLARRDNLYIDDAIAGLLLVVKKGIVGEAYNLSSNGEFDNYAAMDEIAEKIVYIAEKQIGRKIKVLYKEARDVRRQAGIKLDNSKLKKLGWTPRVSLYEGLESMFNQYNADGKNSNI